MKKKYNLEVLTPAKYELEGIARLYKNLVGISAAKKITTRIMKALTLLCTQPFMGVACHDKTLAELGYRMLVIEHFLSFYKVVGTTIFVYHIVDGRTAYPKLTNDLKD